MLGGVFALFLFGGHMLDYKTLGPDANGEYAVTYLTPGTTNSTTIAGVCRTLSSAQGECDRLNEAQVKDKRVALVERANRIATDLPRNQKGNV